MTEPVNTLRTKNLPPTRAPDRIDGEWLEFDLKNIADPFEFGNKLRARFFSEPLPTVDKKFDAIMAARCK